MPSRQERRKADREAAKRAPAQAGASGVNLGEPGGDWTTQASDPGILFRSLGANVVKQRAGEGDREAQWSLGGLLLMEADGDSGAPLGTAGRSPKTDVGLHCALHSFQTLTRLRCVHAVTRMPNINICGSNPGRRRAWRFYRRRKGKGTRTLCSGWQCFTARGRNTSKPWDGTPRAPRPRGLPLASEVQPRALSRRGDGHGGAGLPGGVGLVHARDRADAGHGSAAHNICTMYTVGRGRACQIMTAASSSTF